MSRYTICFDFPDAEGEPRFASQIMVEGACVVTKDLARAKLFKSEEAASVFLVDRYPDAVGWGTVVEVGG